MVNMNNVSIMLSKFIRNFHQLQTNVGGMHVYINININININVNKPFASHQ
jgi:hypothetical protein